ncbi:2-C-methyl-D-erythritol 4-phosphate cytidylyltransferase [Kineosporia succinea]|uniref:2-C-methyl-D-erythritol 4-phosphate cytidylyltransferase n=1 Tax=Kineosporia succinea TaxID=84632 RepID=A0ABT9P3L8_9ACTN|nr:2-C-methyl-D-erythritol 4-phosphate cytidylyltransferase [Kineosporia succinea]MDP9827009.1 2-C-methyl-D-erythritol 4-phosphate cytidylyltransferase [Kineosporia succinea]
MESTAFVAVIRTDEVPAHERSGLSGAGALAVLTLPELAACAEPDDRVVVLADPGQSARMGAVIRAVEGLHGVVVASVRPVTDTLKRVNEDGALTGTADREHHRFVTLPVATRLGLLRDAVRREPGARTTGEILAAVVAGGATVVASAG